MRYLLDSHTFVWLFAKPDLVGSETKSRLAKEDAVVFVSLASIWELELKYSKARFAYSAQKLQRAMVDLGVSELNIIKEHILASSLTKIEHTDPFDLMLCAQAKAEGMTLVTADRTLLEGFADSIDAKL
jgi:PIN domain nuclease of toxin-antitoxin system